MVVLAPEVNLFCGSLQYRPTDFILMISLKVNQKFQPPPLEKISGYATGWQQVTFDSRK